LGTFGSDAISQDTNNLIANAESQQPYVKAHNVWGARYESNGLVTSTGWKELGKWGIKHGYCSSTSISQPVSYPRLTPMFFNSVVGLGYEEEFGPYRRTVQHAL
jgi:hypothetical protein